MLNITKADGALGICGHTFKMQAWPFAAFIKPNPAISRRRRPPPPLKSALCNRVLTSKQHLKPLQLCLLHSENLNHDVLFYFIL